MCVNDDNESGAMPGVWDIDPVCTWIMLAVCLPQGALCELTRAHSAHLCADCAGQEGVAMDAAVRACRSRNALSVAINRRLLQHYAPYHFEMQCAAISAVRHRAQCRLYVRNHFAGFLCALLFSGDARKRSIGVQLAHTHALRGLGRARREIMGAVALN